MEAIEERVKIEPVLNTHGGCLIGSILYTGYRDRIHGSNIHTGKIERTKEIEGEIVKIFTVYDKILVSTAGGIVYMYAPSENKIEHIMNSTIIKSAEVIRDILITGDTEGSVVLMNIETKEIVMKKKVEGMVTAIRAIETRSTKKMYRAGDVAVVVGDALGTVTVFDSTTGNIVYRGQNSHSGQITFIEEVDGRIVTGGMDGTLAEHRAGQEVTVKEVGSPISGGVLYNGRIVLISRNNVLFISREMNSIVTRTLKAPEMISIYVAGDRMFVITEESDVLLLHTEDTSIEVEKVIIGNNDEVIDIVVMKDTVVVGTNSKYIRSMCRVNLSKGLEEDSARYAWTGELLSGSNEECILSMCSGSEVFYTGSKDGYIGKYAVETGQIKDRIELVEEIKVEEAVTAMCIYKDTLITGTEGGVINGWKISDKLSLIFTVSVSSSEITGIIVQNKKIHCTSKEKEIKVVSMHGMVESAISGHKKGIWSISEHKEVLLTGSTDKTARIWKSDTNITLQHNSSVIKVLLTERAVTATSDGVIRIWNTATYKELAAHRITEEKDERIWAIKQYREDEYIIGAGPNILILKDNTQEIEKKKEETQKEQYISKQKAEIFMKNSNYVSASIEYYRLGLERELKASLRQIRPEDNIDLFVTAALEDTDRFTKSVSKWARSPLLFIIVQRILKEALHRKWLLPRAYAEGLSKTLLRTSDIFNSAY